MDEEQYWAAYARAVDLIAACDIARERVFAIGHLVTETREDKVTIEGQLSQLQNNPARHGSQHDRKEIDNSIAERKDALRRVDMRLAVLNAAVNAAQSELSRYAVQREGVEKLVAQLTADYNALKSAPLRAHRREANPSEVISK